MRLMTFAALALLPSAMFAQTNQASLHASNEQPAAFAHAAAASSAAATSAAAVTPVVYHDVIKSSLTSPQLDASMATGGSLNYTIFADEDGKFSIKAPQLIHVVGRDLPMNALVNSDADVTVAFIVDNKGVPRDFTVVHSAGAEIDKGTIAALSQYRFNPATLDRMPVVAHLQMEIKLKK